MSDARGYADQIGEAFAGLAALAASDRSLATHFDVAACLMEICADAGFSMLRVADALEAGGIIHEAWTGVWAEAGRDMRYVADLAADVNAHKRARW